MKARALPFLAISLLAGLTAWPVAAVAERPESVLVRARTGDGFGGIVFDWAEQVGYEARIGGRRLAVTFERPMQTSFRTALKILRKYIKTANLEPDLRTVVFSLTADFALMALEEGSSVTLNLYRGTNPPAALENARAAAESVPEPAPAPEEDVVEPSDLAAEPEPSEPAAPAAAPVPLASGDGVPQPLAPAPGAPRPLAAVMPATESAEPATTAAPRITVGRILYKPDPPTRRNAASDAEPQSAPADQPVDLAGAAGDDGERFVAVDIRGSDVDLKFGWMEAVAVAAFRRDGFVWIVFDRPRILDLTPLRRALADHVADIIQVAAEHAVVLRLSAAEGLNPVPRRDGMAWVVGLRHSAQRPREPIETETRIDGAMGPVLALAFEGAGDLVGFTDPGVGDRMLVVPVATPRLGVEARRRFSQFELLPTAQGVAIVEHADVLSVRHEAWGVGVGSVDGLALSDTRDAAPAVAGERAGGAGRTFDFEAWRLGGATENIADRQALQHAITQAGPLELNGARLDLARFYFAHGLANEAEGLLVRIGQDDPELATRPANRALLGVVSFLVGDRRTAERELLSSTFDDDPEIGLWRGLLAAASGDMDAAGRAFSGGDDLLLNYPEPYHARMLLAAMFDALEREDAGKAEAFLRQLETGELSGPQLTRVTVLRGRVLAAMGVIDEALWLWDGVIESGDRRGRAEAALARISLLLDRGDMPPEEAIELLDLIRFAWRGDDLEFRILEKLGRLYIAAGDYRRGLSVYRTAVTYLPGDPAVGRTAQRMSEIFAKLFLEGAADKLPPIVALALYHEYRELTPPGEKGEKMIHHLANRLTEADLLPQAAELLDHQVRFRLKGAEKTRAGLQLARVYLLDGHPETALEALALSESPGMSEGLSRQRQELRARALLDSGEFGPALAALAGDTNDAAQALRGEIHWRSGNWAQAAQIYAQQETDTGVRDDGLSAEGAVRVLRWALALALAGDEAGLDKVRLRYGEAMSSGAHAEAFGIAVLREPESAEDLRALVAQIGAVDEFEAILTGAGG